MGTTISTPMKWCIFLSLKEQLLVLFVNSLEITRQKRRSQCMICIFYFFFRVKSWENSGEGGDESGWCRDCGEEKKQEWCLCSLKASWWTWFLPTAWSSGWTGRGDPDQNLRFCGSDQWDTFRASNWPWLFWLSTLPMPVFPVRTCVPCSPKLGFHQQKTIFFLRKCKTQFSNWERKGLEQKPHRWNN